MMSIPPGAPIKFISRSSQCSTTGATKAVLHCLRMHIKEPLLPYERVAIEVAVAGFMSHNIRDP